MSAEQNPVSSITSSLRQLNLSILLPVYAVALTVVCILVAYFSWFDGSLSVEPEVWGQFGDFIGGTLNPLVAFMAFIWLARSYELQKVELAETRAALESSQEAQQKLADTTLVGIRLNALNIKLTALTGVAAFERSEVERLLRVIRSDNDRMMYQGEQRTITDVVALKRQFLAELTAEQNDLLGRIDKLESSLLQ